MNKVTKVAVAIALSVGATAASAYPYYSGQGSTYQGRAPAPSYGHAYSPSYDPTRTWQYRFVERAAPVVKGVRDCSFGAVLGGARYGYGGLVGGCAAGATGMSPGQVLQREFNRPVR